MRNLFLTALAGLLLAFLSAPASAQAPKIPLNICTGTNGGVYFFAGGQIAKQLEGSGFDINVMETRGSMENIDRMLGNQCDFALVQNDALRVFRAQNARAEFKVDVMDDLYTEYVHFLCNTDTGVKRITELTSKHTVAIGGPGSGSAVTWESFKMADPKRYGPVQVSNASGKLAIDKVARGTEVQCMLFTAGLNAPLLLGDAQAKADKVMLRYADDGDFDRAKDERGRSIYKYVEIPGGTYRKIQDSGVSCMGSCAVKTVGVAALLIYRTDWVEKYGESKYAAVSRAVDNARPAITKRANNIKD